jgi:hypothetical protein
MRTRRGSLLWGTAFGDAIQMYKAGDVVKPVIVSDHFFTGVVRAVDTKTNKITVAWGGGPESQHDPDEIMPMPFFRASPNGEAAKVASVRRMRADVDDLVAGVVRGEPDGTGPHGKGDRRKGQPCPKKAQHLENVMALQTMSVREVCRALRDAIIAEESAINQYETIVDSTDDEVVKRVLQDIADEEKVHVGEIQTVLASLSPDEDDLLDEGEDEVEDEIGDDEEDEEDA